MHQGEHDLQETICEIALVYPEKYDFREKGKAGIAKELSEQILVFSGFSVDKSLEMLNEYRYQMQSFEKQAESIIHFLFRIPKEVMLDWTQSEFLEYVAKSEWVMNYVLGREMKFITPGEEETENGNENEVEETPSLDVIAEEIRKEGYDPMIVLQQEWKKPRDQGYVPYPMILGASPFKDEEVIERVREQIQRLSNG